MACSPAFLVRQSSSGNPEQPYCRARHRTGAAGPRAVAGEASRGEINIRDLRTADAEACEAFLHCLDGQDIRMRFSALRTSAEHLLPRSLGANEAVALAALDASGAILGIVNLAPLESGSAEVAIVVRSDRKRRGIGRSLLTHAIRRAARDGLSRLVGYVLAENAAMLALARAMGFQSDRLDNLSIEVSRAVSAAPDR